LLHPRAAFARASRLYERKIAKSVATPLTMLLPIAAALRYSARSVGDAENSF